MKDRRFEQLIDNELDELLTEGRPFNELDYLDQLFETAQQQEVEEMNWHIYNNYKTTN